MICVGCGVGVGEGRARFRDLSKLAMFCLLLGGFGAMPSWDESKVFEGVGSCTSMCVS